MDEHDDRDDLLSERPSTEGVRIIRAEEAQAALEAGQAAGRRPDDVPRFGDVPPPPSGPRPAHRFPLPESVDPSSVAPRPPVRPEDGIGASSEPDWAPRIFPVDERGAGLTPDLALPEEGITVHGGGGTELPHWTEPPTGEVPRIRPGGATGDGAPPEELAAWQALGTRGLRWRDEASDWDDLEDMGALAGDEPRLGALDTTRSEHSDMFSFDEQFERLEEQRSGQTPLIGPEDTEPQATSLPRSRPPAPVRPTGRAERGQPGRKGGPGGLSRPPTGGGRDLPSAIGVGIALLLALLVAYAVGSWLLMLLATVVVTACALELFNLVQHRGFRPANLLGLCATVAVMFAAYWRGLEALPLVLVLTFVTSMLWYMAGVVEARPVVNVALTVMIFVWVGVFGSFASLILRVPHGKALLLLPVLVTAAADIVAYFAGSTFGSRPLAPHVSPGKTWEGTIVGGLGAIVVSVVLAKVFLHTTWTIKHAFVLGLLVAIMAPIGDLCESMVKRDLNLKDSGTALPGHGGLLDRFDGLLFVLPATYYLAQYLRLLR